MRGRAQQQLGGQVSDSTICVRDVNSAKPLLLNLLGSIPARRLNVGTSQSRKIVFFFVLNSSHQASLSNYFSHFILPFRLYF